MHIFAILSLVLNLSILWSSDMVYMAIRVTTCFGFGMRPQTFWYRQNLARNLYYPVGTCTSIYLSEVKFLDFSRFSLTPGTLKDEPFFTKEALLNYSRVPSTLDFQNLRLFKLFSKVKKISICKVHLFDCFICYCKTSLKFIRAIANCVWPR